MAVLVALKALTRWQRAAVVLRYWEDRDVEQTALLLGMTFEHGQITR